MATGPRIGRHREEVQHGVSAGQLELAVQRRTQTDNAQVSVLVGANQKVQEAGVAERAAAYVENQPGSACCARLEFGLGAGLSARSAVTSIERYGATVRWAVSPRSRYGFRTTRRARGTGKGITVRLAPPTPMA